jgi:hypothetical protein
LNKIEYKRFIEIIDDYGNYVNYCYKQEVPITEYFLNNNVSKDLLDGIN